MKDNRYLIIGKKRLQQYLASIQHPKSTIRRQRGDTLIEVVLATVIMGSILFSAYLLSSRAFNLGQSAKERSQASQLLVQQAEALRGLRDSLGWEAFRNKLANPTVMPSPLASGSCSLSPAAGFSGRFHMETSSLKWVAASGTANTGEAFDPENKFADFYTGWIDGCFIGDSNGDADPDRFEGLVTVQWPRIGSPTACTALPVDPDCEVTQLHINLTDRSFPVQ